MAIQTGRAQKSRTRAGKQIVKRELIKQIPTSNLEAIVADIPKGTSFKGELRRKCLNEIARREKALRNLIVEHSKSTPKIKEETNNG